MTVVEFQSKCDDAVWVCNCDCSTFYIHEGGIIECAQCGDPCSEQGRYETPSRSEQATPQQPRTQTKVVDLGSYDAAKRRFARDLHQDDVVAAILMFEDGRVRTIGDKFTSRSQRGWLRRRLEDARRCMVR